MSFLINQHHYLKQQNLFPEPYNEVERMIMRNGIKFYLYNTFRIPYPVTYKYFSEYRLLYWSGEYLLEQISVGMIERYCAVYQVIYHDGLTRGYIKANPKEQYALSFRIVKSEWSFDPVVLIKKA